MRVIHGSWLIAIERSCSSTILCLFGYDFTAVVLLNDQPSVVGVNPRPISKPAETDIRNEFVDAASDRESESLPLKFALRPGLFLVGIQYLNIGRIGVTN